MNRESLIRSIERQLGRKSVKMEDRFFEDLGAESIDMLHILVDIESQYGVFIPEDAVPDLTTVSDLYNYLINHQA